MDDFLVLGGAGGLGGIIAYTLARLFLNGKYPSRRECEMNHKHLEGALDRYIDDLNHRLDRLEDKLDKLRGDGYGI